MDEDSVVWDDSYSVGFTAIDNQHKELVIMINDLFQGCKRGSTFAFVIFIATVKKAIDYAQNHFHLEEEYMKQANYPYLSAHKKQHEEFVAEVARIFREVETKQSEPVELARYLKHWLLNHIAISDKQCAPYLAKL